MSENTQPDQNPLNFDKPSEVPPGYDQPTNPAYGAPSYQPPAAQANPYPPAAPAAPASPYPGAQNSPYPGMPQPNPYQSGQQGYPNQNMQPGYQQNMQPGYQQPGFGYGGEQKSKVVAGVLGILLGSLGIHNFYLGKTKIALTQLLITLVSFGFLSVVSAVWGLIEGILILIGHENYRTDAKGIPLKD